MFIQSFRRYLDCWKWVAALIFLVAAVEASRYAALVWRISRDIYYQSIIINSHKNGRGDEVTDTTDYHGPWNQPPSTVIRFKGANDWFSTTLLETKGYGFRLKAKWPNDDILDLNIGFGCLDHATRPVIAVGRTRISYHFNYGDPALNGDLGKAWVRRRFRCRTVPNPDQSSR